MRYSSKKFESLLAAFGPLYSKKDPAHGIGHIRRVYRKSLSLAKKRKVDRRLIMLGALLHGLVRSDEARAKNVLRGTGTPDHEIRKGIGVAIESQADSVPRTIEGKILHDAHLCEGGGYFIAAKCFATARYMGYPLRGTYEWVRKNVIENKKRRCYLPETRIEYARKIRNLKGIWEELAEILRD